MHMYTASMYDLNIVLKSKLYGFKIVCVLNIVSEIKQNGKKSPGDLSYNVLFCDDVGDLIRLGFFCICALYSQFVIFIKIVLLRVFYLQCIRIKVIKY